jgi:hypothetical protein
MEYVIPAVLVLILIGGFVTFLVLNATKKSGPVADADDEGAPGMGADDTPLGDTTEHAGEQTGHGTTAGGQDADASGGTGRPVHSGSAGSTETGEDHVDPDAAAHLARPGEGEGHQALEFDGRQPPAGTTSPGGGARAATDDESGAPAQTAGAHAEAADDQPPPPSSERLADRGV